MTDLSEDGLEKAARALYDRDGSSITWEVCRRGWIEDARAAITAYKDATDPISVMCPSCYTRLHWPWRVW